MSLVGRPLVPQRGEAAFRWQAIKSQPLWKKQQQPLRIATLGIARWAALHRLTRFRLGKNFVPNKIFDAASFSKKNMLGCVQLLKETLLAYRCTSANAKPEETTSQKKIAVASSGTKQRRKENGVPESESGNFKDTSELQVPVH